MTSGSPSARADRLDGYLVAQLNSALRQPKMYGGETSILLLADAVAMSRELTRWWQALLVERGPRGLAGPEGMTAHLSQFLPGTSTESAMAAVYASMVHRLGLLIPDATPSMPPAVANARFAEGPVPPGALESVLTTKFAPRSARDLAEVLGPPTVWCGAGSPNEPFTLVYTDRTPEGDSLLFHFWNQRPAPGATPLTAPQLIAMTQPCPGHTDAWIYTPLGETLLPVIERSTSWRRRPR